MPRVFVEREDEEQYNARDNAKDSDPRRIVEDAAIPSKGAERDSWGRGIRPSSTAILNWNSPSVAIRVDITTSQWGEIEIYALLPFCKLKVKIHFFVPGNSA